MTDKLLTFLCGMLLLVCFAVISLTVSIIQEVRPLKTKNAYIAEVAISSAYYEEQVNQLQLLLRRDDLAEEVREKLTAQLILMEYHLLALASKGK